MFSSGPWKNDGGSVLNAKGHCIFEYDSVTDEPNDADLIAAAPEMYDALQKLYRLGKQENRQDWIEFQFAAKAINKAEGKYP